jgi:hypothetical protein
LAFEKETPLKGKVLKVGWKKILCSSKLTFTSAKRFNVQVFLQDHSKACHRAAKPDQELRI